MLQTSAPLLIVISGPSGVGKDTVIEALRCRVPQVHYAVTATTRSPRPGEINGRDYYFTSREQYDQMLDRGELLAPAQVHGNWYGAPLWELRQAFDAGKNVLLKIDVQGAIQVRRRFPQAVFVFLAPPSFRDLMVRLHHRHTESDAEMQRRIDDARFEIAQMPSYDYVVVNKDDDLEGTVQNIACIITAEHLRTHRQAIDLGPR